MSGFIGDTMPSMLGKGRPGAQPTGGLYQDAMDGNNRTIDRSILRRSFGNMRNTGLGMSPLYYSNNGGSKCGPFRTAFNAGDVLGTVNQAVNTKYGFEHNNLNVNHFNQLGNSTLLNNGQSAYVGNPKKVYDASDYVRYLKLAAKNKTYNDSSSGGDDHYAGQSVVARLKT